MLHEASSVSSSCWVIGQSTFPDSVTYFPLPALSPPAALLLSLSFFHLFTSSAAISSALLQTVSLTLLIPLMILHFLFIPPACSIQSFASRIGSLLSHLLIQSPCKWSHRFLICCPLCSFSRLNPSPLNFLLQLNLLRQEINIVSDPQDFFFFFHKNVW